MLTAVVSVSHSPVVFILSIPLSQTLGYLLFYSILFRYIIQLNYVLIDPYIVLNFLKTSNDILLYWLTI